VVVVATPAHRQAFEAYLAGADVDIAAARADGRYQAIDAAALLHRFAVAGEVDPASFEAEVGHVIRTAGAAGRPVRIYGEMVALLWDAGQLNAALELEGRRTARRSRPGQRPRLSYAPPAVLAVRRPPATGWARCRCSSRTR
jgi:hypothetical protein